MKIVDIKCREILDSRGFPTVETDVILDGGIIGRASIPSGASKGFNEALELRDNEKRFMGKGVKKAVSNVLDIIKPNIVNLNIKDQRELDNLLINLDGTENKTNLGVAGSRDFGVAHCTTPYFMLLDAHMRLYDDNWDLRLIKLLDDNKDRILCSNTVIISKDDNGVYDRTLYSNVL